jgi:hypothetical protein
MMNYGVLLEKAFAKCFGSYENLEAGQSWFAFQASGNILVSFSEGQVVFGSVV